ncbi:MAG: FixH family protein [Rhodospirillaceae bacterium]|nr:FixH family protein [Rhodospirillales bacterium]
MRKLGGVLLLSALLAGSSASAWADAKDYRFEAVQPHVAVASDSAVAVRLVHVPSGKPVTDAIILPAKMEMPMAGMGPMPTKVSSGKPDGKGAYAFTADLSMAGTWMLQVAAKVQGEPSTITGSVPFTAANGSHNH